MQKTALCGRFPHYWHRAPHPRPFSPSQDLFAPGFKEQMMRVMKLTFFLLTVAVLNVTASALSQKVTFSGKDVPLEKVIRVIEKQTDFVFAYNLPDLKDIRPVSIEVANMPLEHFLKEIFKAQPLQYAISKKTVVITRKVVEESLKLTWDEFILLRITGVIKGPDGQLLSGASVKIKGSEAGVVTNSKGVFDINVAAKDKSLVISYIGMETQELAIQDGTTYYEIKLKSTDKAMDDVVVNGYSTLRKSSFTGNAVTVDKKQLLKTNPNNLISALQVFDPSFRIKENTIWGSDPNAMPEFTIRGESSIGMDKSLESERLKATQRTNLKDNPNLPIFILDGFEVKVQTIYDMDINRIENVTILKDAAATAMYGSRAANGVLVVTTIAPRPGEMRVTYNVTGGVELPDLSDYNLTNSKEKLEAEVIAGVYNLNDVPDEIKYNDIANRIRRGINTDWLAQPVRNVFNHTHSLFVEGGVESIRYAINVNHDSNKGAMKGSYRSRTGAGLTLDYRHKRFQLKNQITYNSTRMEESPYGTFITYANQQPYEEIFDENGEYKQFLAASSTALNPLWKTTLDSYIGKGHINEIQNNFSTNWNIARGLQFKGQLSLTKLEDKLETYKDPKEFGSNITNDKRGTLSLRTGSGYSWNVNAMLHYNREIGKHFINANTGINTQEKYDELYTTEYLGFQLGNLQGPSFSATQPDKTGYTSTKTRLFGTLASVNYSYDNIYLFDASFRMDGSSQFGKDERTAPFWATGVGINVHNYDWMKAYPAISSLKVRGSYGTTGKVNFPAYTAVTSYEINADSWYYTGPAASIIYLGNPSLKWENTRTLDAGFELGLLNNRFFLRATYYHKETNDLIDQVSISSASGFTTYRANSGTILNKGVEFDINAMLYQTKDWSVNVTANLASNKNIITKLGAASEAYNKAINAQYEATLGYKELKTTPLTRYYVGASTTAIYAVPSAGIDPANGMEKFIKKDGSSTYTWSATDQLVVGDRLPDFQGAFGFNIAYKRIYLNTSFLYHGGAQVYNLTLLNKVENADIRNANVDRRVLEKRWKQAGDVVPFLDMATNRTTRPTDRFVQDYDFLNLNSLSIGYDFGKDLLQKLGLASLGLRLNANDIFRWSTVTEERGTSYPYAKNYGFTINVSFK